MKQTTGLNKEEHANKNSSSPSQMFEQQLMNEANKSDYRPSVTALMLADFKRQLKAMQVAML